MKVIFILLFLVKSLFAEQIDFYVQDGIKIHLSKVKYLPRDVQANNLSFYEKDDGSKVALNNTFFVKMKDNRDLTSLLLKYDLELVKQYSKETYLLKVIDSNILETIHKVNLDNNTIYAHPNFYNRLQSR